MVNENGQSFAKNSQAALATAVGKSVASSII
jgi:hypothetical protein